MEIKNNKWIKLLVVVLCISLFAIFICFVKDDVILYYNLCNEFYSRNIDEGLEEAVEISNKAIFEVDNYYGKYDPYSYNLNAINAFEKNGVWFVDYTVRDNPFQIVFGGQLTVKINPETKEIISIEIGR